MSILSKFYFSDVGTPMGSHRFKCNGAGAGVAAAGVSAGGSVLGSLIGGIFSSRNQMSANRANRDIAQMTNAMNYKIASEANAAQLEQLAKNQMWQERMYEKDRDYNSMAAQMARARAAGINPYALAGNGAGVQGGTVPSSPSAGYTPAVPTMQAWRYESPFGKFDLGSTFSNFANGIAELVKAGIDKEKLKPAIDLMNAQTGAALASMKESEAKTAFQNTANKIQEAFGFKKADAETREIQKRIDKLVSDIALNDANLDNVNADTMVKQSLEQLNITENELKKVNLQWLPKELEANVELKKEQKRTEKSVQASNYASAEESRQQAFDLRATRQDRIDNLKADKDLHTSMTRLNNIDYNVRNASVAKEIEAAKAEFTAAIERSKLVNAELKQQIAYWKNQAELAKKQKDWYAYTQAVQMMRDIAIAGGAAAGGYKAVKTAKPQRGKTKIVNDNVETTTYW